MVKKLLGMLFGVLFLDILTKTLVAKFKLHVTLLPFFAINYVENTGGIFGFAKNQNLIFIFLSITLIIGLSVWYYKTREHPLLFGLILAGAIGNLIDRLVYGFVVDFLDFFIGNYHWYIFNIADAAIITGILLLIYKSYTK